MNLSEHPLVLDYRKRLADVDDQDFLGVTIILPGMPNLMGELRLSEKTLGLFLLTTNIQLGKEGQAGRVDFAFTADKPVTIIYPTSQKMPESSRIVKPH